MNAILYDIEGFVRYHLARFYRRNEGVELSKEQIESEAKDFIKTIDIHRLSYTDKRGHSSYCDIRFDILFVDDISELQGGCFDSSRSVMTITLFGNVKDRVFSLVNKPVILSVICHEYTHFIQEKEYRNRISLKMQRRNDSLHKLQQEMQYYGPYGRSMVKLMYMCEQSEFGAFNAQSSVDDKFNYAELLEQLLQVLSDSEKYNDIAETLNSRCNNKLFPKYGKFYSFVRRYIRRYRKHYERNHR